MTLIAFVSGGPICGARTGVAFSVGIKEPKHQSLCGLCTSSPEALPNLRRRIPPKTFAFGEGGGKILRQPDQDHRDRRGQRLHAIRRPAAWPGAVIPA